MNKEKNLLIIGPLPENHGIGGVTIHVQRLLDYLNSKGIVYDFLDYGKTSLVCTLKKISRASVVHIHISNPVFLYVITLTSRFMGKKIFVTLHGNYGRFSSLKNFLVRRALAMSNIPILINEKSYKTCRSINKHAVLIPAFIPPQKREKLQDGILSLLDGIHSSGRRIVSTNAYNISVDKDGNDIYGIGYLVKYFERSEQMALVVSDPSGNYQKKYADLNSESVFFIDYPHSYFEVLKHVDFFVRNTSTDGDALSVKEALYLGVPTLCSDVVDRPEGVRLFKYCDDKSFEDALSSTKEGNNKIENGAIRLLELYRKYIS